MIRAILQSSWKILTLIVTDVIVTIVFCLLNSQDSMLWGILDYSNWHPLSIFKSIQELFMVYNLADLSTDDVLILCCLPRCMLALYAVYIGSARRTSQEDLDRLLHPFRDQERSNADACEDELILEEPFCKWFRRFVSRCAFPVELFGISNLVYLVFKAMVRLYHEIHLEDEEDESHDLLEEESNHPIWWISVCLAALITILEIAFIDECCVRVANTAIDSRGQPDNPNANGYVGQSNRFTNAESKGYENVDCSIERVQNEDRNNLRTPLLARDSQHEDTPLTYEPKDILKNSNSEIIESDIGSKANYRAGWDDLISLCKPDLHLIAVAFVFLILAAFTQVLIPQFTGNILDALSEYDNSESSVKDFDDIWQVPGFTSNILRLVVAATFCGLFSGIRGGIFTVVGGRVNARLRMQLLDSLFTQDIGFFDTTKTGDITSRLCNDTTLVGNQVTLNINVFLRSFVQALGVLLFMFMISWQLTLLAFISVPIITVMSKIYGLYMSRLTKLMQKRLADGNTVSESAISSMSTIRAFGAESSELKEYNEFMTRYLNLNLHSAVAYVGYMSTITTLPLMVTALVLFYGGLLVLSENENDHITSGELVSFLLYLTSLSDAFNSMGNIFSSLTQAIGAADKVFELMHRTPQYQRWTQLSQHVGGRRCTTVSCSSLKEGCSPRYCAGEVNLRNIEMYYPARPDRKVLSNLSLEARRGTVVALVGPSGGGKSSVISLIQHLYEQTSGEVTIDDIDVRNLSHEWLSRHIAIVSQEPVLFARSIKRNIIFGLEGTENEPSMEDIVEAARLANAADFIETLPAGYETDVGERGVQLSGGQKQRIAIARALVRKPRILLLDEATSALDAESESSVQQAIDMMLKMGHDGSSQGPSMTVIVVAHRLSTIRSADMIYVLSDGKVVEKGKHEELLSSSAGGAYANLIACQVQAQKSLEQY